jgi:hypothetical protein
MSKVGQVVKDTLRPSPFHYTMFIAAAVLLVSFSARFFFGGEEGLDVRFRDRRGYAARSKSQDSAVENNIFFADGDRSVRYSQRLRDASQIAFACGIYVVRQRTGFARVVPDIETLLNELEKTPLYPPIITDGRVVKYADGTSRGVLQTATGLYYVSYRPKPLAFDVLAAGARGLEDGPVFVVRFPEVSGTIIRGQQQQQPRYGSFATVFLAPPQNALVPVPFSPADSYRAAGWAQEPVRSSPVSQDELTEINRFLQGTGQ